MCQIANFSFIFLYLYTYFECVVPALWSYLCSTNITPYFGFVFRRILWYSVLSYAILYKHVSSVVCPHSCSSQTSSNFIITVHSWILDDYCYTFSVQIIHFTLHSYEVRIGNTPFNYWVQFVSSLSLLCVRVYRRVQTQTRARGSHHVHMLCKYLYSYLFYHMLI